MARVTAECSSCSGTGLYRGFAEPPGVAVICLSCDGSGAKIIEYKPFMKRNDRNDIREVRWSAGSLIVTGVGPTGGTVSYDQFKRGILPEKPRGR